MELIGKQRSGQTVGPGAYNQPADPIDNIIAILVIKKDLTPADSSYDDMVNSTGSVDSRLSEHVFQVSNAGWVVNIEM